MSCSLHRTVKSHSLNTPQFRFLYVYLEYFKIGFRLPFFFKAFLLPRLLGKLAWKKVDPSLSLFSSFSFSRIPLCSVPPLSPPPEITMLVFLPSSLPSPLEKSEKGLTFSSSSFVFVYLTPPTPTNTVWRCC